MAEKSLDYFSYLCVGEILCKAGQGVLVLGYSRVPAKVQF